VWPLPIFERFYIGGWGMKFYKHHWYMFQVTHKAKQIKRCPPLASKTTVRILVKLRISFLIADGPIVAQF